MATSDQLQRLESAAFDFELRFFAGGKYGYMDLAGIETGATWSLPSSTELTADIDPSSTVIPVDDTTGFTGGTILIHPHEERPEEEFELVAYAVATADEFQQLQRGDMQTAYSGTHLTGATVSEWYEITNKITDISSLEVEDKGGWVDWRATISGLGYDSVLLDNDNAILCLWRFSPKDGAAGTWTDWEVGFLGYVREFNLTDTSRQEKSFRLTIGGLGMYLGSTDLRRATLWPDRPGRGEVRHRLFAPVRSGARGQLWRVCGKSRVFGKQPGRRRYRNPLDLRW